MATIAKHTAITADIHRRWGYSRREAALRGALTALFWWTVVEVGDGTTRNFGFSYEDYVADILGAAAGYLHETNPWVHRTLDWRVEYFPSDRSTEGEDPISDYWGTTYLLAGNTGALLSKRPSAWDYLDLQVGYRTRGYALDDEQDRRWLFVGVGLNVANLLRTWRVPGAAIFDYFQLPWVSIRIGYDLNEGDTRFLWGP